MYNETGFDAIPLLSTMMFNSDDLLSKCCPGLDKNDKRLKPHEHELSTELIDEIEEYVCTKIDSKITQLEWIKLADIDVNPRQRDLLKYIPKNSPAHRYYMKETNFTLDCRVMPFIDDNIRVINHIKFKGNSIDITGVETMRP